MLFSATLRMVALGGAMAAMTIPATAQETIRINNNSKADWILAAAAADGSNAPTTGSIDADVESVKAALTPQGVVLKSGGSAYVHITRPAAGDLQQFFNLVDSKGQFHTFDLNATGNARMIIDWGAMSSDAFVPMSKRTKYFNVQQKGLYVINVLKDALN